MGVLSPARDTEWGLPMFIIPKMDGRVPWVSDMRELNKVIKKDAVHVPNHSGRVTQATRI